MKEEAENDARYDVQLVQKKPEIIAGEYYYQWYLVC